MDPLKASRRESTLSYTRDVYSLADTRAPRGRARGHARAFLMIHVVELLASRS